MNIKNIIKKFLHKDNRITPRPSYDIFFPSTAGVQQPEIAPSLPLLKYVHDNVPVIKIATMRLRETIFRRGFEWKARFKSKCMVCDKEYKVYTPKCPACGGLTREPNEDEIRRAEDFFKRMNKNRQHLLLLLKQVEDDVNIFDDAYIIGLKEYYQDAEGNIIFSSLKEIVRGNPVVMRVVTNEVGEIGGQYWTCLHHRDFVSEDINTKCPKCGRKLYEVHYVSVEGDAPREYYVDGEVIHFSKYSQGIYGYSPIITLWKYAMTLTHMVDYVYHTYTEQHLPKGVLAINTTNPDSAFRFWRDIDDKLQKDPHYIPKMFIENDGKGHGLEFVRFMDTLEEMQYIPVRDEIRRTVASLYGITNIFYGDTQDSGGLNSEAQQIEITKMAAESAMQIYNDNVLPEILEWLHISDWVYVLKSPFETARKEELAEQQMEVNIAKGMLELGMNVELTDDGHFKFSGKAKPQVESEQQPVEQEQPSENQTEDSDII